MLERPRSQGPTADKESRSRSLGARVRGFLGRALGPVLLAAIALGLPVFAKGRVPEALEALLVLAAMLAVYVLHARFVERREPVELAPRRLPELVYGALLGMGLIAFVMLVLWALGAYRIGGIVSTPVDLVAAAVGVLAGAAFEEMLFRGYIFRWIARRNVWGALAATSLFFGFAHLANPHATLFSSVAIAVEAGLLLGAAYWLSGNLWFPIGIHAGWNFAEGPLFNVPVSGTAAHGLVRGTIRGHEIITGGAFGIEASVVALIACTAAGVVMLLFCIRTNAQPVR